MGRGSVSVIVHKKLPFTFVLKENGRGAMKFLFMPVACIWECDGNVVTVHMKDKDVQLTVTEDQLILEGQNGSKALFRKAA